MAQWFQEFFSATPYIRWKAEPRGVFGFPFTFFVFNVTRE